MTSIALLICTRDRAEALRDTLAALRRVRVPEGLRCALIVVDNASADPRAVAETVRACAPDELTPDVRLIAEPRPGKSHAYNAGLAAARAAGAEILLTTDDDVRPPGGWLGAMCAPIIAGAADAVAGGIRIAPHLQRPWMEPVHRAYLAATDGLRADAPDSMIGANMAFSTRVLERVPAFDPELGPAGLGTAEESLFSLQIEAAGFRLVSAFGEEATVEHHFDPSRLSRASFLAGAEKMGRSWAYVAYHWEHFAPSPHRPVHILRSWLRLLRWRLRHSREWRGRVEGCAPGEMNLTKDLCFYRQLRIEERRPRNYDRHGLQKKRGVA
jgi:glycosyltransferase involved in cell wall biosynthesis